MSPQSLQALRVAMMLSFAALGARADAVTPGEVKEEGKKRFNRALSKVEVELIERTSQGSEADFSGGDTRPVEEAKAKAWGADRRIGADFIAWLCTSPKAAAMVTHKGVRVRGVRVEGVLDLANARVPFPLAIVASYIPGVVDCSGAELDSLDFDGSSVGVINGRSARVTVDVRLRNLPGALKLDLSNGRIGGDLDLSGSRFSNKVEETIYADYLSVGRDFVMTNGFTSEGSVRLAGASIRGDINCAGGSFLRPDGVALNASGIDVKGNAYLSRKSRVGGKSEPYEEFRVEGATELSNARIAGDLHCGGGLFFGEKSESGYAIRAHGLDVGGDARLDFGFQSRGRVDLTVAQVGGSVYCQYGKFSVDLKGGAASGEKDGVTDRGLALDLGSATVGHDVVMGVGFSAEGVVRLEGTSIAGRLDCFGGHFKGPEGRAAIEASWMTARGDVHLGEPIHATGAGNGRQDRFEAVGVVRLTNARIGGDLVCRRGRFGAGGPDPLVLEASGTSVEGNAYLCDDFHAEGRVVLYNAKIGRYLYIREIGPMKLMNLNLDSAKVGVLHHAASTWPGEGKLAIDGFSYELLDEKTSMGDKTWLDWLGLQKGFSSGPYEQLATVLTKAGNAEDAKRVLIEKERRKGEAILARNPSPWDQIWYRLLGPLISYGYNPLKAIWYGVIIIAAGTLIFWWAYRTGRLAPKDVAPGGAAPAFTALIYSIDLFTPIISLFERENWMLTQPDTGQWKTALLRTYWVFHIAIGWTITSLAVAGLLGLIRHD